MIALALYFGCNFGIFLSYLDMDVDKEFKKATNSKEHLYSNLEYGIILFLGLPMLGMEVLAKAFKEDDDNS